MFFMTIGALTSLFLLAMDKPNGAIWALAIGCLLTGWGLWDHFLVPVSPN